MRASFGFAQSRSAELAFVKASEAEKREEAALALCCTYASMRQQKLYEEIVFRTPALKLRKNELIGVHVPGSYNRWKKGYRRTFSGGWRELKENDLPSFYLGKRSSIFFLMLKHCKFFYHFALLPPSHSVRNNAQAGKSSRDIPWDDTTWGWDDRGGGGVVL
jgi:hypothetical protein